MRITPIDDRVLLMPVEAKQQSGSIIIPDMAKEKPIVGEVVAVDQMQASILLHQDQKWFVDYNIQSINQNDGVLK